MDLGESFKLEPIYVSKAPQPQEPDTSEVRYTRGHERVRNANLFYVVMNACHHLMSERAVF